WGRMNGAVEGGVYFDQVAPIGAQVQTPAAPANLRAMLLPRQIHVTWEDRSTDETGFRLEVKDTPAMPPIEWRVLADLPANTQSFQMNNPLYQHTYQFRVAAYNEQGDSPYSNPDTVFVAYVLDWLEIDTPNGGENWPVNSLQQITWRTSSFRPPTEVTIDYSIDGGSHWIVPAIASGVPNSGRFDWVIPHTPSATCLVRVRADANGLPYDLSNSVFSITLEEPSLPPHWQFTANTGQNATVILPADSQPLADGQALNDGDVIGCFTRQGLCAGHRVWSGENLALTVWGDNDQTTTVDGFLAGELFCFRLYRPDCGKEWILVEPDFSQGDGKYTANAVQILSRFHALDTRTQERAFLGGWNLFSVQVEPFDARLESLFVDIQDDLLLIKDGLGRVFIPAYGINDIGELDPLQGFQAFLNRGTNWSVRGQPLAVDRPISLLSGWNMVSYLPTTDMAPARALISLMPNLGLAKNGAGQTYIPQYAIDDIREMKPGEGYQLYLQKADTLIYPIAPGSNSLQPLPLVASGEWPPEHFCFRSNTGENATIILPVDASPHYSDGKTLEVGDEIGLFNHKGHCCGAAVWQGENLAITAWGDDAMTDTLDGFAADDTLRFRVWSRQALLEYPALCRFQTVPVGLYRPNAIWVLESLVADMLTALQPTAMGMPTKFALHGNYPNPFNPTTRIAFAVPARSKVEIRILSCDGKSVDTKVFTELSAGEHEWIWQAKDREGRLLPSGVYFYRILWETVSGVREERFGKMLLLR
ncbi:hypothetical protein JW992_02790, partial [candidate division KSB1 bacterium]|nr:hypothetical protein [candidate division KSB1 bacterium]